MAVHPRKKLRDDLRAALAAHADFAGWTQFKAWAHRPDESQLPAWGVFTPRETVAQSTGLAVNKTVDLVIALRIAGGEAIEDEMDAISATVEDQVIGYLQANAYPEFGLLSTDLPLSLPGAKRLGDIDMLFQVVRYTVEGQP